jgi:hypothetical protein
MTNDAQSSTSDSPDTIDVQDEGSLKEWGKKLNVTDEQLKEAVAAVGTLASDVELHLKGSRSTTNKEHVDDAGG